MLCAGVARVAGVPQAFWAVWDRQRLWERTTLRRGHVDLPDGAARVADREVAIDLVLEPAGEPVEVISRHGGSYIWTRKQGGIRARGTVNGHPVDARGIVDESAGYHARRTAWVWSAGVGRAESGAGVAWNLVTGVHDAPEASERTVWVDGESREVGPVEFARNLSGVGDLDFKEWSAREDHTNLLLFRSDYRQPFGTFGGRLPDGTVLAEGYGVMEEHDVRW
jgi:hypothetical protein